MAANPVSVVERRHAVQYDGTNSGDIDNLFSLNTVSETGGVWTFQSPPGSSIFVTNTNDWILYAQNMALQTLGTAAFENFYRCNAECTDMAASASAITELEGDITTLQGQMSSLTSDVNALETDLSSLEAAVEAIDIPSLVVSIGTASVPASVAGASQNITVNLSPAQPDTSYTPLVTLRGTPTVLSGHGITGVSIVDADTITVTVQSAPLSLAGGTVHAVAIGLD